MEKSNYGIDTKVLEHLINKRSPVANPDNDMIAALNQAGASLGTLGGRTADTTSVQNLARAKNQENLSQQKIMADKDMKLAAYLDSIRQLNQRRQQQIADKTADRIYKKQIMDDERKYKEKLLSDARRYDAERDQKKMELAQQNRMQNRADDLEDYRKKQEIAQQMSRQAAADKATPKDYDQQLANLSGEQLKRFDSSAMGLQAVVDMQKALKSGSNTFSLIGDNPYTMSLSKFEEALGRMQSGGAITSDEVAKFKNMAPSVTDSTEIQRAKMQDLITELASRVQNLGFNPEEVLARRRATGEKYKKYDLTEPTASDAAFASQPQFKIGEVKEAKGKSWRYIGNDIWEEVE